MSIVYKIPRILISSHKGGAGKTLFTIGLISVLREKGLKVSAFKKGPDYIDAGWLTKVSSRDCRNLDLFLFDQEHNLYSFYQGAKNSEIAIIEGNRGLFDGIDVYGSCSSSALAKLLKAPVILVIDCTKVTRSVAALVKGFMEFEEDVKIKGVILNNIARERHANVIRNSVEYYTGVPVLGVIYKLKHPPKERHLGLITSWEYEEEPFLKELLKMLEENCNLEELLNIAKRAEVLSIPDVGLDFKGIFKGIKVGIFRDPAFQFYYPENLEAFLKFGAELIYVNALSDSSLDVDALYIGGGFPEVQAEALAENERLREEIRYAIKEGMPVYAECGGLMYLGKEIVWKRKAYPMVGVLPFKFVVEKRPQGHGYVIARVIEENPYFELGAVIKGHEFHYSKAIKVDENKEMRYIFELEKGFGIDGKRDGILFKNLLASYTHIHIFSVKYWAEKFLEKVQEVRQK